MSVNGMLTVAGNDSAHANHRHRHSWRSLRIRGGIPRRHHESASAASITDRRKTRRVETADFPIQPPRGSWARGGFSYQPTLKSSFRWSVNLSATLRQVRAGAIAMPNAAGADADALPSRRDIRRRLVRGKSRQPRHCTQGGTLYRPRSPHPA